MKILFFIFDLSLLPLVYVMSLFFYFVRVTGQNKLTFCNRLLLKKGVLPTRNYFEKYE
jgi:hypothetical protein